jgi:hypothetical protein
MFPTHISRAESSLPSEIKTITQWGSAKSIGKGNNRVYIVQNKESMAMKEQK